MSHLEHRNKEVESEIFQGQTSQDDIKRELEKYLWLYQEELEGTKLLENKLSNSNAESEKINLTHKLVSKL